MKDAFAHGGYKHRVHILKPSIDDAHDPAVIRGVVSLESLQHLCVDHSYQRERLGPAARKEITKALENRKTLPDIELGMRGDHWDFLTDDDAELHDPVYIIDGYQRVETIKEHIERFPSDSVRLGGIVHLKTTPQFERDRFQALNLFRAKVSPSVLLRNCKEEVHLMAQLYGLSKNPKEVMYGKVCWSQHMAQAELIKALTYCQVALLLHTHMGSFASVSTKEIPDALDRLEKLLGLPAFRGNIIAFWDFMETTWGIRSVSRRGPAIHTRSTFLTTLCRIISDHTDFWTGNRLTIPYEIKRKLAKLPMSDPEIIRLSGASGKAIDTLYYTLVQHINSGKRTKRITDRYGNVILPPRPITSDEDEDEDVG